jgi:hypothetical protein
MLMCFYMNVPMPFGVGSEHRTFIFLPWSLFFVKKFRSHYKGCKCLPSQAIAIGLITYWFPPLEDTPPITTINLLQLIDFWHINMVDLPQAVGYGHGEIFTTTLSQLDSLSLLPFSLFYSFIHFLNLQCVS